MTPFTTLTAVAMPLLRENIDTDIIIPSREIKAVSKTGLAAGLFAGWRYLSPQTRIPDPDFILNDPDYAAAQILLAGGNFGCGSSREQAVWALAEYGFRAVIAPSFNPIFRRNCLRNGLLPIELDPAPIAAAGRQLVIDLPAQTVSAPSGAAWRFAIDAQAKTMLVHGLDEIDVTLQKAALIAAFRADDRARHPWVYL
jgi:3-isopropylmalate/(R)-2-methylmalate dehydratase small subunit